MATLSLRAYGTTLLPKLLAQYVYQTCVYRHTHTTYMKIIGSLKFSKLKVLFSCVMLFTPEFVGRSDLSFSHFPAHCDSPYYVFTRN